MRTYLAKRGSSHCFRRAVAVELRPYLSGRSEWMISLWTKDRETAKRLIPARTMETDRLLEAAQAPQAALQRDPSVVRGKVTASHPA